MAFKLNVFYAWQATTNEKYNKVLIRDAIQKALNELEKEKSFKEVKFYLDHDTKNESGMPNINVTIDEKIAGCNIFIADMTNCNGFKYSDENISGEASVETLTKSRVHINDNVSTEYGQAKAIVGIDRLIAVSNEFYGKIEEYFPKDEFDVNHNRYPIGYTCADTASEEDIKNVIDALSQQLKDAIRVCAKVALDDQDKKYRPFVTLQTWKRNTGTKGFFSNEKISSIISAIQENQNSKKHIRLIGLSGLGKTSIAQTAFDTEDLKWCVRYCDCFQVNNESAILSKIDKMCDNKDSFYLVVDNCSKEFAGKISNKLRERNTLMPILTVYNDPSEKQDYKFNYLLINTTDTNDIVKSILCQNFPNDDAVMRKLSDFASNNPRMAVLLIEGLKRDPADNLAVLNNSDFLGRLLKNENPEEHEKEILQSYSLFDFIAIEGKDKAQIEFVADNENITSFTDSPTVKHTKFRKVFANYYKKQIFERHGDLVGIRPKPLAWYLLTEWFTGVNSERMISIINDIQGQGSQTYALMESMCRQLRYMNTCQPAVEMLNEICRIGGPFASADVVYSMVGSRLLRAFSEVNPPAVAQCLFNVVSETPVEKLVEERECRRDIVGAAQVLAFDPRTFEQGAKILLRLALAENESWGNNATNNFTTLFSVHLPSTAADLTARFKMLKYTFANGGKPFGLKAISSALKVDGGFYMGGPERQGTTSLKNYEPPRLEIEEYIRNCLDLLMEEIKSGTKDADKTLCDSLQSLMRCGYADITIPYIGELAECKSFRDDYLLEKLYDIKRFSFAFLYSEKRNEILDFIEKLSQNDFVSQFKYLERQMHEYNMSLSYNELNSVFVEKVKPLAENFVNNKKFWKQYLLDIYSMDSLFISEFGKIIAELLEGSSDVISEKKIFIDSSIDAFNALDKYDDYIFLKFIRYSDNDIFDYMIQKLIPEKKLHKILFECYGIRNIALDSLDTLFDCVDAENSEMDLFDWFWNWFNFVEAPDEQIAVFFERLTHYQRCLPVLMSMTRKLQFIRRNPIPKTQEFLKDYIINVLGAPTENVSVVYEISIGLLKTGLYHDLANEMNTYLLGILKKDMHLGVNGYYDQIYEVLLELYFGDIWANLSQALLSRDKDILLFLSLKNILGYKDFMYSPHEFLIDFTKNKNAIEQWCNNNPQLAPQRLAELCKVYSIDEEGKMTLTDCSVWLIEKYGSNSSVLEALYVNLGTYSVNGSAVPKIEEHLKFVNMLKENSNNAVAGWAEEKSKQVEQAIKEQKKLEDEENFIYG